MCPGDSHEKSAAAAVQGHAASGEPDRVQPEKTVGARYSKLARAATAPELALRRALYARGRRYRVQVRVDGLPRRSVDIVFPRQRLAVFVDGCFWHRCPDHGTDPRTNSDWWRWKLDRTVARDRDTDERLRSLGWHVMRVWEHEDADVAATRVLARLDDLSATATTERERD